MKQNKFFYENKYQYLTHAMLNVTDDCNLRCKYCFVEQNPHYMTLQTAKDAADFLYNNYQQKIRLKIIQKEKNNCCLYFFGGEPTLCYNSIIVPIVNYCKEKYPNSFSFGITTNGTLLNEEKIKFFKDNNFSILLSIDGNKITQDYNRPCKNGQSSFDLIEKNIPILLKYYPDICFRSTIFAPTVDHLFENYLYAESLGFKNYEMIEDNRHEWSKKQLEQLKNEFSKIYCYRIEQILKGIVPINVPRINRWLGYTIDLYNKDSKTFNIESNNFVTRCGLGTVSGSIGWDGSIYGCQEQTSKVNKSIFYIGNIYNGGIDIEKHNNLLKYYYESQIAEKQKFEKCKNCDLNQLCKVNTLSCPSTNWDLFQDMNSITEINCYIKRLHLQNSLLYLKILFSFNNDFINSYLKEEIQRQGGMIKNG